MEILDVNCNTHGAFIREYLVAIIEHIVCFKQALLKVLPQATKYLYTFV